MKLINLTLTILECTDLTQTQLSLKGHPRDFFETEILQHKIMNFT